MPVFPGQLRYIRKNLFTGVYVFDPATVCGSDVSFVLIDLLRLLAAASLVSSLNSFFI